MENKELRKMADAAGVAISSQVLVAQQPVKNIAPKTDGEEAAVEVSSALLELVNATLAMFRETVNEKVDLEHLAVLAQKHNDVLHKANKKLEALTHMNDEDKNTPQGNPQTLKQKEEKVEEEDRRMAFFAETRAEFEAESARIPGTEVVEVFPGVMAVKYKNPTSLPSIFHQEVLVA